MDEKEIILKAKKDPEAFDYLYEKYFPRIFNYVMMRVQDRTIAEDIVSNVFFKALKKLYMFRWQSVPFSAWLYRIAINEISEYYRKEKRNLKLNDTLYIEQKIPKSEDKFSYSFIHEYIKKLPIKDQELISLKFFEKKSYSELSDIFCKKESALRVRLHRALKKLENLIPKEVLEDVYQQVS